MNTVVSHLASFGLLLLVAIARWGYAFGLVILFYHDERIAFVAVTLLAAVYSVKFQHYWKFNWKRHGDYDSGKLLPEENRVFLAEIALSGLMLLAGFIAAAASLVRGGGGWMDIAGVIALPFVLVLAVVLLVIASCQERDAYYSSRTLFTVVRILKALGDKPMTWEASEEPFDRGPFKVAYHRRRSKSEVS